MAEAGTASANVTVVSGTICQINSFKPEDDWEIFSERLEQYCSANVIADDRKVAVLLTLIDESVYKTLKNLCDPELPKSKTYEQLVLLLQGHYQQRVSSFRKRIVFNNLRQGEETVSQWYAKVKQAAAPCKFGRSLEERVKDKFVTGLKTGPVLDRLCEEAETKGLQELYEMALAKEATLKESRNLMEVNKLQKSYWKKAKEFQAASTRREPEETEQLRRRNCESGEKKVAESVKKSPICFACGNSGHNFSFCRYKNFVCNLCKKKGHIGRVCKQRGRGNFSLEEVDDVVEMFNLEASGIEPIYVSCVIEGLPFKMELDTGAGMSCIPFEIYTNHFNEVPLSDTTIKLKTYDGTIINPVGRIRVKIQVKEITKDCELVVVKGARKILMGRDLCSLFEINLSDCSEVHVVSVESKVDSLVDNFKELFNDELGCYNGSKISLSVSSNVRPIFCKPKPVPYAYKDATKLELERLEKQGVIERVDNSAWGTPLVIVLKANGKDIRLCANYKITVNRYLEDANHPLPRIENMFTTLQGGQHFTKLDFKNAYNQLQLTDETGLLLAWSTEQGIFKINRLPFGTKPACSIFQLIIEKALVGIPKVINFLDDIVVTGESSEEHLNNLKEVFIRLTKFGFKLNKDKCQFFKGSINYLGHIISAKGLEKDLDKVSGILKCPQPKNVSEVKAFCGMVNYYSRFLPNISTKLKPLYRLCEKNNAFEWSRECNQAFELAKQNLICKEILVHYDPGRPLRLACDASFYGIGACLSHVEVDGSERPICYISRVLNKAEKNYPITQKEGLSVVWAVHKLYHYLAGRHFEIVSDHKALQTIFGENKSLPQMAAGRIQRWSLFLANFNYTFKYVKNSDNTRADALSRLPVEVGPEKIEYDYLNFVEQANVIDVNKIRSESRKDVILGRVYNLIRYGFEATTSDETLKPYYIRQDELHVDKEVVMWGYRVVIPFKLRESLLRELHSNHEGMVRMKATARSYFWWPSLDSDIEKFAQNCEICAIHKPEPHKSIYNTWVKTSRVFERVHADFLGPFLGKTVLVIIDSYSKWPEAYCMSRVTAEETIEKFRECFSRFGLPELVVTDNAGQFTSSEFTNFLSKNGIKFMTSPVCHPASNGQAENLVKTFKNSLLKCVRDSANSGVTFNTLMNRFLFSYRNTQHTSTGVTPSSLVFKYKTKTRLDLLRADVKIDRNMFMYKGKRVQNFEKGEMVYCRDYRNPNKKSWAKGCIDEVLSEAVYLIKLVNEDVVWKRHLDQIMKCYNKNSDLTEKELPDNVAPYIPIVLPVAEGNVHDPPEEKVMSPEKEQPLESCKTEMVEPMTLRCRSGLKPPQRLNL